MDDIRKFLNLIEAEIKPGDRKDISFKLKKLEKAENELMKYQSTLQNFKSQTVPPELQKQFDQLQSKLSRQIKKLSTAFNKLEQENIVDDRPIKMNNFFKALVKHCSQICKVYKELNKTVDDEHYLFRGIHSTDDAIYGKPRENRNPESSDVTHTKKFNQALEKLGFEARRDNSVFCSGDWDQAGSFGDDIYIVFPVDNFQFTFSKKPAFKDIVLTDTFMENFKRGGKFNLKQFEEVTQFQKTDIVAAIKSMNEVYVRSAYYALNQEHLKELLRFLHSVEIDTGLPEYMHSSENEDTVNLEGAIIKIEKSKEFPEQISNVGVVIRDEAYFSSAGGTEVLVSLNGGDNEYVFSKDEIQVITSPDKIPDYMVGDDVKIIDLGIEQKGKTGHIRKIYDYYGASLYDVRFPEGKTFSALASQIEPVAQPQETNIKPKTTNTPDDTDSPLSKDYPIGSKWYYQGDEQVTVYSEPRNGKFVDVRGEDGVYTVLLNELLPDKNG